MKSLTCKEEVIFNIDTLSKVISFLPSTDLLNLALTCTRFSASNNDDELSLIEESTRFAVEDIATEEQLAALPCYEGETSLADYHYLLLLRAPLAFDQLIGDGARYMNVPRCMNDVDKSCVGCISGYVTAFSNNVLTTGKHYVTFEARSSTSRATAQLGVIRPGHAIGNGSEYLPGHGKSPLSHWFYKKFSPNCPVGHLEQSLNGYTINCCMFCLSGYVNADESHCYTSDWAADADSYGRRYSWGVFGGFFEEGPLVTSNSETISMLLDLDKGTLSVYNRDGHLLGVTRGLSGHYCWAVYVTGGDQVSIKRGTIPSN